MARSNGWRKVGDRWTRSLGMRGLRVRLFQKRKHGVFYRTLWVGDEGKDRKCLGTNDRREAERLGRALIGELRSATTGMTPTVAPQTSSLTLGELWRRYSTTCAAFLDNVATSKANARNRAKVLLAYFGSACRVETLTGDDQAAYEIARRAGGIRLRDEPTRPVRARSAEADLVLLHQNAPLGYHGACRWQASIGESPPCRCTPCARAESQAASRDMGAVSIHTRRDAEAIRRSRGQCGSSPVAEVGAGARAGGGYRTAAWVDPPAPMGRRRLDRRHHSMASRRG